MPGCPEPAQPGPHAAVGGGNLLACPQQQFGQVGIIPRTESGFDEA